MTAPTTTTERPDDDRIARLEAENTRLREQLEHLTAAYQTLMLENRDLDVTVNSWHMVTMELLNDAIEGR